MCCINTLFNFQRTGTPSPNSAESLAREKEEAKKKKFLEERKLMMERAKEKKRQEKLEREKEERGEGEERKEQGQHGRQQALIDRFRSKRQGSPGVSKQQQRKLP